MKSILERYFDTPDKRTKLYLLITFSQIWATIALVIGFIVFLFLLLRELNILVI
ncbi:MAG: hypothetical protein R6U17_04680 [Thermoplasmata archaeon]